MKKNQFHDEALCRKAKRKLLLMFKFVFLMAFITSLNVAAYGYAQTRVSMSFKKMPLKQAISLLEKEGRVRILYSDELLPQDKMVTLTVKDELILSVLNKLLANTGLTYKVLESDLVAIVPDAGTAGQALQRRTVKGRITDADNKPLPGVSISVEGGRKTVLSD